MPSIPKWHSSSPREKTWLVEDRRRAADGLQLIFRIGSEKASFVMDSEGELDRE